jgi:pyruvate dehydrogenase (quinone)
MLISFLLSRQKNLNEMAKKVAELFVEVLTAAGVERIYGVAGDSLNGITDSVRVHKGI